MAVVLMVLAPVTCTECKAVAPTMPLNTAMPLTVRSCVLAVASSTVEPKVTVVPVRVTVAPRVTGPL